MRNVSPAANKRDSFLSDGDVADDDVVALLGVARVAGTCLPDRPLALRYQTWQLGKSTARDIRDLAPALAGSLGCLCRAGTAVLPPGGSGPGATAVSAPGRRDWPVTTARRSGDGRDQAGPAFGRASSRAFSRLSALPWA